MKKTKALMTAVASGILIAFVLLRFLPSQSINSPLDLKPVTIAVSPSPLSAPLYVAQHNALFKKHGVNVNIVSCNGGANCAQLLIKEQVEFATASESVVMFNSFEHKNVAVLTSFVESDNDLKLLSRTNYGIREVKDLVGKKVGVIKGSASEFYLDSLLVVNNMPNSAIEKIYLLPTDAIEALFSRKVDAVSIWEPFGYLAEQKADANVINLGLPGIYQLSFNLLATKAMVEDKQVSIRVLKALNDAVIWIKENPQQAQTIVSDTLMIEPHQLAWSWNDFIFRLALGNSLLSNLQMQARWALNLGLVQGDMPDFRLVLQTELFETATKPEE